MHAESYGQHGQFESSLCSNLSGKSLELVYMGVLIQWNGTKGNGTKGWNEVR